MQACIDVAFPYAHIRDAFGKKIGEHQVFVVVVVVVVVVGQHIRVSDKIRSIETANVSSFTFS